MSEELEQDHPSAGATGGAGQDGGSTQSECAQISRAMVAIYKEQFGRGPVKTWTEWAGPDTVLCILEGSLTPAELKMREMGEHQRLRDVRMYFQYATTKEFIEPIERITGRTVRSFISGIDSVEDVSTELFVLYPVGAEGESRADRADG